VKKVPKTIKAIVLLLIGVVAFLAINNMQASAGGSDGSNPVASVHMSQLREVARQVAIVKNTYCLPAKAQQKARARFENNKTQLDAFLQDRGVQPLTPGYDEILNRYIVPEFGSCP
jgi:hypothetical protein